MSKDRLFLFLFKIALFPCFILPHRAIHAMGKCLGSLLFYILPSYRKRALSNLSLASSLKLSEKELKKVAKESFQNLAINCLEYPKFSASKDLSKVIICENPEYAESLIKQKQGIVFFCGHQSNWEVLFLEGTKRMPGVAIGRPINNKHLYDWVISIREKFGGKIIAPQHAIKEGFRALKQGKFLGIVGDQGMPDSGFSSLFLGRKAFTSPSPALLAYRTKCPLIVATTRRSKGKYFIHYSDPIWPNLSKPLEEEVESMMNQALKLFENSVYKSPGEWLWQHNRWKQETPRIVYYKYRYDAVLIILPEDQEHFSDFSLLIKTFREIYPSAFLTIAHPAKVSIDIPKDIEVVSYASTDDLLVKDYKYKLVFNFSSNKNLKKHYLKCSAFHVFSFEDLEKEAAKHIDLKKSYTKPEIIVRALCRKGTLWED